VAQLRLQQRSVQLHQRLVALNKVAPVPVIHQLPMKVAAVAAVDSSAAAAAIAMHHNPTEAEVVAPAISMQLE
jgi:hypothetical protein